MDQEPRPQRTASTKKHGAKRANSVKANRVTRRVVMFAKDRQANKPGEDSLSMFQVQYQRGDGTCSPGWIQLEPESTPLCDSLNVVVDCYATDEGLRRSTSASCPQQG